jgi:SAM-dependent methyltransferase
MKGFDPRTSFGHETSLDYDAVSRRGDEEETVAFLAGLAGGGAALELAVGTGRIALPLMKAGVRVDGIELSKDMVDRMREKPGGDQVEVVMGDMSRVTTGRSYGLVYLVFNTIGNLLTQEDQVRCFENAARHLTDDGVFVVECRVPTAPARPGHQFIDVERLDASPACGCATGGEGGTASRSPPPAGATSASTSTRTTGDQPTPCGSQYPAGV